MPLCIVGKIINRVVTVLTILVVFEFYCIRPMCFVFCQSMNNEITLSLTLKLYGRKGLISTTCMMWMVNKYISKIHWGNNRTQNDNWDSANWWTHLWIWTRCAIASFALYWLVTLTQEEDKDLYNKHMYKQKTVAFCKRSSNSSSLWHILVLRLSLLTGAHNNHIIWWPTSCRICACRVLAVKYDVQQASSEKWMSEYNHRLKILRMCWY